MLFVSVVVVAIFVFVRVVGVDVAVVAAATACGGTNIFTSLRRLIDQISPTREAFRHQNTKVVHLVNQVRQKRTLTLLIGVPLDRATM